ncbi:fimbrial protein [Serratia fonticola]|uniref:fimbrial protein n=1 Tax=Serratia fonticola TaxID=47917 RepID=UPI002DBAEC5A|nr:fimbrial protein [Serratia fonticola]MEB7884618.1 fimbrial protein [Serratia fonticola]
MMKKKGVYYSVMLGMVGSLFAVQSLAANFAPLYTQMTISGFIQIPLPCTISGDGGKDAITVKFGDAVSTTQLDGVNYRQPINYSIDCKAGTTNALKLSISGDDAGFGNGILKTKVNNLGIKITYGESGSSQLALGTYLPFNYSSLPKLYATPVKRPGSTLTAQPFSASATLLVSIQ